MTDDQFRPYNAVPQARLRVTASYAATDGRQPETIDVEINDAGADLDVLRQVIGWLAGVPGNQHIAVYTGGEGYAAVSTLSERTAVGVTR